MLLFTAAHFANEKYCPCSAHHEIACHGTAVKTEKGQKLGRAVQKKRLWHQLIMTTKEYEQVNTVDELETEPKH